MFGRKKFKRLNDNFIDLVNKYTSFDIDTSILKKDISKFASGIFANKFNCSLFYLSSAAYAIRFDDNMKPESFNEVFDIMINDLGKPDYFVEFDGYVWEKEGYYISHGLVALNYNYEVPMICVKSSLSPFNEKIKYDKYENVSSAILNNLQKYVDFEFDGFYKLNYFKNFGYSTMLRFDDRIIEVQLKNLKLSIEVIPLLPHGEYKLMNIKNSYCKKFDLNDFTDINEAMAKLLEQTKEYHKLTKDRI